MLLSNKTKQSLSKLIVKDIVLLLHLNTKCSFKGVSTYCFTLLVPSDICVTCCTFVHLHSVHMAVCNPMAAAILPTPSQCSVSNTYS